MKDSAEDPEVLSLSEGRGLLRKFWNIRNPVVIKIVNPMAMLSVLRFLDKVIPPKTFVHTSVYAFFAGGTRKYYFISNYGGINPCQK